MVFVSLRFYFGRCPKKDFLNFRLGYVVSGDMQSTKTLVAFHPDNLNVYHFHVRKKRAVQVGFKLIVQLGVVHLFVYTIVYTKCQLA